MSTSRHRAALILAIVYFAALAAIAFWPSPVDRPIDGDLRQGIDWLSGLGIPPWLASYSTIEICANVLLFVPFGTVVTLRLPLRHWWVSVVVASLLSGAIELLQGYLLPQRVASWSDILANTSGAFLGAVCVLAVRSRLLRRARRKSAHNSVPTVE
ncbi:VanZ family protein [Arthrobacter alpinus]|uniref:VanZ family protein n=1 Tax=Arthrobacter alpinus TaxID=656366 RepID=UPI00164827A7|nr:VanZ family protein [Arthrobacter alpinus]